MDPVRPGTHVPWPATQPFPSDARPAPSRAYYAGTVPAQFANLPPRGRSLSMSNPPRMPPVAPFHSHAAQSVAPPVSGPFPPVFPASYHVPMMQGAPYPYPAQPFASAKDSSGGVERTVRHRSASMSRAETRPPRIEVPRAPRLLRKDRTDIPAVQRNLNGSVVFGPSASLSDAMPFLINDGGHSSRLVASFNNDDGTMTMGWVRVRILQLGMTSENARAAIKHLIRQIPVRDPVLRPFLEWHVTHVGNRAATAITSAHEAIEHSIKDVDAIRDFGPASVKRALRTVSERMHRVAMAAVPTTRGQRDAPRAPVDFVVDWMVALRRTQEQFQAGSNRLRRLKRFEREVRRSWLDHHFAPDRASAYFAQMAKECRRKELPVLSPLANHLSFELDALARKGPMPLALLYENDMMRQWETSFVNRLVQHPPAEAVMAADGVRDQMDSLMRKLRNETRQGFDYTVEYMRKLMNDDRRFWMANVPTLEAFLNAKHSGERGKALLEYLSQPVDTGEACVSVYYTTVKFSRALRKHAKSYVKWDNTPQDDQDFATRDAARAILKRPNVYGVGTGLHLAHQPGLTSAPYINTFSSRPALRNRPNLSAPSATIQAQLAAGLPYGSGPSGSAAFACKFVDYANRERGARIDRPAAVLGAFMFVAYDGGHSLNEVMWEMNLLKFRPRDTRIDMGIRGSTVDPNRFVGRYLDFVESFSGATRDILYDAFDDAFEAVLRYDRQQGKQVVFGRPAAT